MYTFKLPNYPSEHVHIALYINIKNLHYIKNLVVSGNLGFQYTFIDASTIISFYQILAAVHNSIRNCKENELRTKNIYSEIIYSLSSTLNITDAFEKFGITDKTENLIVIKIGGKKEQAEEELKKIINGTEIEPNDSNIEKIRDMTKIYKNYKLNENEKYDNLSEVIKIIISSMAMKSVI
ncbi:hypothetical protein T552_02787 [Pneumocystis carinii B80]|uniref:EKC/KEOPS complex subunit CGI121 n=1 Tax=Pneumocystis carinii (strain B80) TaxID=1408658 RepID=A0A0W4ZEJ9_PNEC8|nr:hypothetical protein T552_02787 [Pneumocystis carinii B80]KTW26786.1 hypothetical protein T552_02787 [Pneumocystis carinii B80]